jgi:hypothetical protein
MPLIAAVEDYVFVVPAVRQSRPLSMNAMHFNEIV